MRQNIIAVIVGGRGVGKSTYIKQLVDAHAKKSVVFDTDDNAIFRTYPVITCELLKKWQAGKYRLIDTDTITVFEQLNTISNAMIVIEDATKFIEGKLPQTLKQMLLASKQRNVDILLTFHSFRRVPPDVYQFANYIELFKTGEDDIAQFRAKIPSFEKVHRTKKLVDAHQSRFFHKTIQLL